MIILLVTRSEVADQSQGHFETATLNLRITPVLIVPTMLVVLFNYLGEHSICHGPSSEHVAEERWNKYGQTLHYPQPTRCREISDNGVLGKMLISFNRSRPIRRTLTYSPRYDGVI